jgi:hypothetical protein
VPIALGFLDFKRKVGGVGPILMPTGDIRADFTKILAFYEGMVGKNPSLMSEIELPEEARGDDQRMAAP